MIYEKISRGKNINGMTSLKVTVKARKEPVGVVRVVRFKFKNQNDSGREEMTVLTYC